jgi:toxin ParE1/3/4
MKLYTVVYTPEAEEQLVDLYLYIAAAAGNDYNAARFVDAITRFCDGMEYFPERGEMRDDIKPGLRITNYDGSTNVAFTIDEDALRVEIIGIFYGGRDYARHLDSF